MSRFRDIRGTCDTVYHEFHQQGVGTEVKHAAVISSDEEDRLWLSGCTNPLMLWFSMSEKSSVRGVGKNRENSALPSLRTAKHHQQWAVLDIYIVVSAHVVLLHVRDS